MLIFKVFQFSFICPECKKRMSRSLSWINNKVKCTRGFWCKECNARIKIQFMIKLSNKNKPKLSVSKLLCNDKEYKKKFTYLP